MQHLVGGLAEGEQVGHARVPLYPQYEGKRYGDYFSDPRTEISTLRSAARNVSICADVTTRGGCRRSTLPYRPEIVISMPASWRPSLMAAISVLPSTSFDSRFLTSSMPPSRPVN